MSKFTTRQQLLDEIRKERAALEQLLADIPKAEKTREVTDGMSVKDFLAHRTEWGRMFIDWYETAKAGGQPAVPHKDYKWNQLKPLNAAIFKRYQSVPLAKIEKEFNAVHDRLYKLIENMSEEELFTKHFYGFTGTSDLATYANSATAAHYRSARRCIKKWWKAQTVT